MKINPNPTMHVKEIFIVNLFNGDGTKINRIVTIHNLTYEKAVEEMGRLLAEEWSPVIGNSRHGIYAQVEKRYVPSL